MAHRKKIGIRQAGAAVALCGALVAGGAGVAQAATQGSLISAHNSGTFKTWFWGKTKVCITDVGTDNAAYEWWSSTGYGSGALVANQQYCMTKSFAGFQIKIHNNSVSAPLQVTFPIGP